MKKILLAGSIGVILLVAMIMPASGQWYYDSNMQTNYDYDRTYRRTVDYYSWYIDRNGRSWNWNYNWNGNSNWNNNWNWNYNYNSNQNSNPGNVCTMEYRYGLTIYLQDENGQPLTNATITATRNGAAVNDFTSFQNGQYSGLGEGEGYYNVTIQRSGYSTHRETIKLERDGCHVISQMRTVTLFQ